MGSSWQQNKGPPAQVMRAGLEGEKVPEPWLQSAGGREMERTALQQLAGLDVGSHLSPAALAEAPNGRLHPRMAKRESRGLERVPAGERTAHGSRQGRGLSHHGHKGVMHVHTKTHIQKRDRVLARDWPKEGKKHVHLALCLKLCPFRAEGREGKGPPASCRCLEFDSWARYLGRVRPTFNAEVRLKEEERLPGIAAPVVWEGTGEVRRPWRREQRRLGSVVALMLLGRQREAVWCCKTAGRAGPVSSSLDGGGQKGPTELTASRSRERVPTRL